MAIALKNLVIHECKIYGKDLRSGQVLLNILHYLSNDPAFAYDVTVTGATMETAVTSIYNNWLGVMAQTSIHYELRLVELREVVGVHLVGGNKSLTYRNIAVVNGIPGLDRGQQSGETLPPFAPVSIRKITSRAGRSYRGGLRFGLVPESKQSNGALTSTYRTALQTEVDHLIDTLDTGASTRPDGDFKLQVFAHTVAFAAGTGTWTGAAAADYSATVVSVPVNPNVATQRSRKPKQSDLIDQTA